jgi:glycosyltransferase involved in cell wall biosynthesis
MPSRNGSPPSLSVVIPVYNEADWIERSVQAVVTAAAAADWPADVIVVDDGSTDATPERLRCLVGRSGVRVLTQANRGRFAARRAGLAAATGDRVLLLDSRVIIEPGALKFLRDQVLHHSQRKVWNGHVNVHTDGNPFAAFWSGLVGVAWRRYLAEPRLVSFDSRDFDAYPKGTTIFFAPRSLLIEAAGAFSSLHDDPRLASDDTRMLRYIAERERIHLCPDFAVTYHGRDSLSKFVRQAYYRGTTFVDGYLDAPGPVRRTAATAAGAGLLAAALLARRPAAFAALALAGSAGAAMLVRRSGGSPAEARSVAVLLPLFAASFGAGAVRGLGLVTAKRLRG